jgi:hypothetical protein
MKMREAPWSAAAKLPPWNPNQKTVAGATALQGAFGATTSAAGIRPLHSILADFTRDRGCQLGQKTALSLGERVSRDGAFTSRSGMGEGSFPGHGRWSPVTVRQTQPAEAHAICARHDRRRNVPLLLVFPSDPQLRCVWIGKAQDKLPPPNILRKESRYPSPRARMRNGTHDDFKIVALQEGRRSPGGWRRAKLCGLASCRCIRTAQLRSAQPAKNPFQFRRAYRTT